MIEITEEVASDLVKILAAGHHSKYTWQQIGSYMGLLQQKLSESQLSGAPPLSDLPKQETLKNEPDKKNKPRKKS